MKWTLRSLLDAAGTTGRIARDAQIWGLAYDSRAVEPGDLFCCMPGTRTDGHRFARQAVERGATALLAERELGLDVPEAVVPDVRRVLGPLAAAFFGRPSEAMAVAGVTGTNGKTTVTYLLEAMASAAGLGTGVVGTVESRIRGVARPAAHTTPEAVDLQRLLADMRDAGVEMAAVEVTSIGLDQHRVDGTRFACVGFTNLTRDHIEEYHGTFEAYAEAKAKLFDPAYAPRAVVNLRDPAGAGLVERARGIDVLTYGTPEADLASETSEAGPGGTTVTVRTPAGRLELRTRLVGAHNVENLLCATGIALQLGLAPEAIAAGALDLSAVPGRLEPVEAGQPFTVLVDYAHTPDALTNALRAARGLADGKLIVVFGCGGDRDRGKRPLMGLAAAQTADLSVITSDNPRSEDPQAIIDEIARGAAECGGEWTAEPDRRVAIELAIARARPGDVVLIAGKGHETGQTFADRTIPFDDRVVAREVLTRTGSQGGVGWRR